MYKIRLRIKKAIKAVLLKMDDGSGNSTRHPSFPVEKESGSFDVCTWNVNSVKARLPVLSSYLQEKSPDIVMLQEIKTEML